MWILHHKDDPLGETRILKPNSTYLIGRDKDVDIQFTSGKASRHQLKLVIGKSASTVTPLSIVVLSRAKSKIQDNWYRLNKGDPEQTLDLTNEKEIVIECADDGNGSDSPINIQWNDFDVFCEDRQLKDKIGDAVNIVETVDEAGYYVGSTESDTFKKAVIRGISILNQDWIHAILENNIKFLDVNSFIVPEYAPSPDRKHILDDIKIFSNEDIPWLDNIIIADADLTNQIRKDVSTEQQFILIGTTSPGLETETIEKLWQAILSCSLDTLKLNKLSQLKRPISASSSSIRKRRKYEKVDKLHFFSLAESVPTSQVASSQEQEIASALLVEEIKPIALEVEEIPSVEGQKDSQVKETTNELPESGELTNATSKMDSIPKEESTTPTKTLKRKPSIEIKSEHPHKIGKFMSKISFVDAIKQTKQQLTDSINQEFGISQDHDLEADLNFSNLAIVEVVSIPKRTIPKPTAPTADNPRNQKKFKKNIPLKSKFLRSYVPMNTIVIDNNISFSKPVTIGSDFNGLMNDVKGFAPEEEQLFVPDEDYESSVTQPQSNSYVKQEESDDDDDQPKFGFS